jgi:lipopolysaccharide export system protein LptA
MQQARIIFTALWLVLLALPALAIETPSLLSGNGGPVEITADESLEWNETEQVYIARGNAMATRQDFTVTADKLSAFQKKTTTGGTEVYKLVAEGNVKIVTTKQQVYGDRAVYDVDARAAVVTGRGLKFVSGNTIVTARDRLEYSEIRQMAVARGRAIAIQGTRRVEGDVLTAAFRKQPNGELELQQMTAEGNVVVVTPSDVARGQRAIYDMQRNVAVMTGGVQVTRGQSQLEGAVAEVDFASGLSRIMNDGTAKNGRVRALLVPNQPATTAVAKKP